MTTALIAAGAIIAALLAAIVAQRQHIDRIDAQRCAEKEQATLLWFALRDIAASTATLRSGTARRVHRAARNAIGGEA